MCARSIQLKCLHCLGILVIVVAFVAAQTRNGIYTVVAPKALRPNTDYHVAVSIHDSPDPVFVTVEIDGIQDSGGRIHSQKQQQIDSSDTRILQFPMGDLGQGSYNISVSGTGGVRFSNTTTLEYVRKSLSVFIQTDKAIYKPGQKVMFRAIVVDRKLRPSATTRIDVFVSDGKQNRVKQFKRAFTNRGVFSGEVELSDQPVLGDWNITVTVLGQEFSKTFKVAEYILPKFEVDIDLPPFATFRNSEVTAVITARYTYGKPVKGEATVSVSPLYKSPYLQPFYDEPLHKVASIDGRTTVKFNLAEELKLTDDFQREILFDVTVEEALTGRRQNTSGTVKLFKYPYKLELIKMADAFKPGLKYSAFLKVANQDDTPIQDAVGKVIVRHGFSYNQDDFESNEHWIPANGLIPLSFSPPATDDVHVLSIEAEYKDLRELLTTVVRAQSPSNTYIQADLKTEHPKVNDQVEVEVRATKPMSTFVYEVLGRGNIVLAQAVQANDQTNYTIRFPCLLEMAPRARVLVHFVTETGEVVADAIMFEANGTFQNQVEVEVEPESRPGKNVQVKVKSEQDSFVGLLGIDQSVLLLKSGNDVTKENVIAELESYDSGKSEADFPLMMFKRRKRSALWPGSATAADVFQEAGVIVLTNGYVHEAKQFVYYRSSGFDDVDNRLLMSASANAEHSMLEDVDDIVEDSVSPDSHSHRPRLRRNFAETWLWNTLETGFDGSGSITSQVPDSITSWVISAFSVHSLNGLGIAEEPAKLRVFKPFFISMNYPYSVMRGETLSLQAVVFNYQSKSVEAELTLSNDKGEFEFVGVESNEVGGVDESQKMMKKKFVVNANDGTAVTFMIKPLKVGSIDLQMTARSRVAEDSVLRQLLVKAEGAEQYRNKAVLINLQSSSTFKENVTIDIPPHAVNDSFYVEVSAVGDIMGPAIRNLDHLLKLPYGCGEQNMLNFVPNIVVYEYLRNINQLDEGTKTRAKRFMEIGYQRELTYMRDDNSFSAFGNADSSGSTWLTAFVVRSFNQANALPDVDIDESVMLKALSWLVGVQTRDGSFPEVGKVSHKAMQGGAGKGLALTAYVAITFLETEELTRGEYKNVLNRALDYMASEQSSVTDLYTLAVLNYAFHLAKHHYRERLFNVMEELAKTKDDMKYWAIDVPEPAVDAPWVHQAVSVDIEMTSYMLMTYVMRNLVTEALPIMKWLIAQRNAQGGFASTQDTVIGITALGKLAERLSFRNTNMEITFLHEDIENKRKMFVTPDNLLVVGKHELPGSTRWVEITGSGRGMALVQVSYKFNLNASGAYPSFALDPQIDKTADQNHLLMSICTHYNDGGDSNMAIMEVALPSGYTIDADSLPSIRDYPAVRRVESHDGNTNVVIYFDKIGQSEICPTVSAYRTFPVAEQKPVPVVVRDYYDHSRQARAFYEVNQASLCDICEGDSCTRMNCRDASGSGGRGSQSGSSAPPSFSSSVSHALLLVCCYVLFVAEWR